MYVWAILIIKEANDAIKLGFVALNCIIGLHLIIITEILDSESSFHLKFIFQTQIFYLHFRLSHNFDFGDGAVVLSEWAGLLAERSS